jgi:hypothetical protein
MRPLTRQACRFYSRIGAYNSESRDGVAGMALVEKHYPDYRE